ncbi:MAG: 30S ribosomal protein S4 [Patescibacteria group bacterium]
MARYTGPKHARCRRYGVKLCDSAKCPVQRRPYPPGQHGPKGTSRMSEYGIQLAEKQKAKAIYGLLERQFANYYKKAKTKKGDTGQLLLQNLERRLDNVVFRLGIGATHAQARQLVGHGLITVNGKRVTIPSYSVRPKEAIGVSKNKPKMQTAVAERLKGKTDVPAWLELDKDAQTGTVTRLPESTDVNQPLNLQLIVEHYSR